MSLADKLKGHKTSTPERTEPLWKGPEVDGITQSLLGLFLICRERFRIRVIEGLRTPDEFNHRIHYGNMWHTCEESMSREGHWNNPLLQYTKKLCKKYPTQQDQIVHWHNVCAVQYPTYLNHWSKHDTAKNLTPLLQEQNFAVPYELPSGRKVILRGKWDGVNIVGTGKRKGLYLKEHKTKGDVDPEKLQRQLTFDMQTMFYLVALEGAISIADSQGDGWGWTEPLSGVNYNVVRRPLSGGVGSIRQHKPTKSNPSGETSEQFYKRLQGIIEENRDHFFARFQVEVSSEDIQKFKHQFLNPILEQLCVWYHWVTRFEGADPFLPYIGEDDSHDYFHWRHPFGVWNSLNEGGSSEYDEFMDNNSTVGLERSSTLFPELEEE